MSGECSIDGCEARAVARGLCRKHYAAAHHRGTLDEHPRVRLAGPISPGDGDPRHGTPNGYLNLRCRCAMCREANRVQHLDYMHARPDQQELHRQRQRERNAAARRVSVPTTTREDNPCEPT